jgi:hypothetical protein
MSGLVQWLDVAGSIASILGLVAALWAAYSAKAAKAAAEEARLAMRRMRAREDAPVLLAAAQRVVRALRERDAQAARSALPELRTGTRTWASGGAAALRLRSHPKLARLVLAVRDLDERLFSPTVDVDDDLIRAGQTVVDYLAELAGAVQAAEASMEAK